MISPRIPLRRCIPAGLAAVSLLILCSCTEDQNQGTGIGTVQKKPARPAPKPRPDSYKKGYKTENPHQIISPYPPHNLIDISKNPKTGEPFRKGDFAKDPSNGQIFRIP